MSDSPIIFFMSEDDEPFRANKMKWLPRVGEVMDISNARYQVKQVSYKISNEMNKLIMVELITLKGAGDE